MLSRRVAVVSLSGEHDLSTTEELEVGLRRGADYPVMLVDLSQCSFIDSTVIALIVNAHRAQVARAARLELILPATAGNVRRVADITGLNSILTTHTSREAALIVHAGEL